LRIIRFFHSNQNSGCFSSTVFLFLAAEFQCSRFMRVLIILLSVLFSGLGVSFSNFKKDPMSYTRVRMAYVEKEKLVLKNLSQHSISRDSLRLYLRAFKSEKILELWARNECDTSFALIKEMEICEMSGYPGPKRRSGDLQVPEGFYHISDLNPYSKYFLSMEINYPNASESIRGVRGRLGNQIYIHGDCISSGCLAMSDERIKELFIYCIEAYKSGQQRIDITIYPAKLSDPKFKDLTTRNSKNKDKISLWSDLKRSYDLFEAAKIPPVVTFLPDGNHQIN